MKRINITILREWQGFKADEAVTMIENTNGPLVLESDNFTAELSSAGPIKMFKAQEGKLWMVTTDDMPPVTHLPSALDVESKIHVPEDLIRQRDELLETYGVDVEITEDLFELVKGGWEDMKWLNKEIANIFKEPKQTANNLHKHVVAQEKAAVGQLTSVTKTLKKKIEDFQKGRIREAAVTNLGEYGEMATAPTGSADGGTQFRQMDRTYKVHNFLELVKAVAAEKLPLSVLQVNDEQMKIQVKAAVNVTDIPGVLIEDGNLSLRLSPSGK